jgi:hypothetical protein
MSYKHKHTQTHTHTHTAYHSLILPHNTYRSRGNTVVRRRILEALKPYTIIIYEDERTKWSEVEREREREPRTEHADHAMVLLPISAQN